MLWLTPNLEMLFRDERENTNIKDKTLKGNSMIAGMRIRFWTKTGSGALHYKLREIFKSLLEPRAPDPVRILMDPDPGWFSEFSTSMVRLTPKVWKQKRRRLKLSKIFA